MADTTAAITYFAVKGMHFYNAESCKELIIIVIRIGSRGFFFRVLVFFFLSSLCGEFSISFYPAGCDKSHGSLGAEETSERPSPNPGLCI